MSSIAEQVRKKKEQIKEKEHSQLVSEKEISESSLSELEKDKVRKAKLQKLKELEAELVQIEQKKEARVVDQDIPLADLEEKLASHIKSATKGEIVLRESDDEAAIRSELESIKQEMAKEKAVQVKTHYEKLVELHNWIEETQYEFMYAMPHPKKAKRDFESWREEWSQVLLDYARVGTLHIIFPKRLLTEKPFNKFINRKKSVLELCEALVEKDLAKWIGNKKKKDQLRIYWKSLEEWTAVVEQWAYDNAIFDVIMIPDIRKSKQEFALLPVEDLKVIFRKLEKMNKATMIELENNQFGIKFKLI
ncbi:MAG: hypothetical protein DRO88_08935 [Promethearchaeia archaeon]|nr:MAG: hypothetical protein DRO88_08935 [Candidatus Lokiarchaeia archaeon]